MVASVQAADCAEVVIMATIIATSSGLTHCFALREPLHDLCSLGSWLSCWRASHSISMRGRGYLQRRRGAVRRQTVSIPRHDWGRPRDFPAVKCSCVLRRGNSAVPPFQVRLSVERPRSRTHSERLE
jgi:hypothetical protein